MCCVPYLDLIGDGDLDLDGDLDTDRSSDLLQDIKMKDLQEENQHVYHNSEKQLKEQN